MQLNSDHSDQGSLTIPGSPLAMVIQKIAKFKSAIGFALLFAAAITPTLLVQIPAMEDYLDHLGRMYVLTTAGTSEANPYYQVSWALYPDLRWT